MRMLAQSDTVSTGELVELNRELRRFSRFLLSEIANLLERQRLLVEHSTKLTSVGEEFGAKREPKSNQPNISSTPVLLDAKNNGWEAKAALLLLDGAEFAVKNLQRHEITGCLNLARDYGAKCYVEEVSIRRNDVYPKKIRFAPLNGSNNGENPKSLSENLHKSA